MLPNVDSMIFLSLTAKKEKEEKTFVQQLVSTKKSEVVRMVLRLGRDHHGWTLTKERTQEMKKRSKTWKRRKGVYQAFYRVPTGKGKPVKSVSLQGPETETVSTIHSSLQGTDRENINVEIHSDDKDEQIKLLREMLAQEKKVCSC